MNDYYVNKALNRLIPIAEELTKMKIPDLGKVATGFWYKKTGVMAMNICPQNAIQTNMFDTLNRKKDQRIMGSIRRRSQ
ncbi:MAG: hypothetical protein LBU51_06525 [Bacteroidales bacterium]|nr:hypothetical protein [Bacteroidales bacterium]